MVVAGKAQRITVENATSDADLRGVKSALAVMTDVELDAMSDATYKVLQKRTRATGLDRFRVHLAGAPARGEELRAAAPRSRDPA